MNTDDFTPTHPDHMDPRVHIVAPINRSGSVRPHRNRLDCISISRIRSHQQLVAGPACWRAKGNTEIEPPTPTRITSAWVTTREAIFGFWFLVYHEVQSRPETRTKIFLSCVNRQDKHILASASELQKERSFPHASPAPRNRLRRPVLWCGALR